MGDLLGSKALSFHQDWNKIIFIKLDKRLPTPDNTINDGGRGPVPGTFRVNDIVVRDTGKSLPFAAAQFETQSVLTASLDELFIVEGICE